MSEASGLDRRPNQDLPEPCPVSGDLISPDPLLKTGTFIDSNNNKHSDQNSVGYRGEPRSVGAGGADSEILSPPATETTATGTIAPEFPPSLRRSKRTPEDLAAERPPWLPEGWRMDVRIRASGGSRVDRYYFEPVTGHRFRSKNEVLHFLETGNIRKRKMDSDADALPSDSPGVNGEKKVSSKNKNLIVSNFDFKNTPNEVVWVFEDGQEQTWSPILRDEKVPESSKQEWDVVFSHITHQAKPMAPD